MLKQIGIAAACGIALYGIARYVKNNYVIALNAPTDLADLFAVGRNAHDDAETKTEVPHEGDDIVTMPRAPADAAVTEVSSSDTGQTPPPDGAVQAAS
jgi:hypothetical protein